MHALIPVYLANFFFTLHYALTLYINSTYLSKFFSPAVVSLLFILGAVGSSVLLFLSPGLLRRYDLRRLLIILLVMDFVSVAGLVVEPSVPTVALSFILFGSVPFAIYYLFDIFLENLSTNAVTGRIRGSYLTVVNTAIASAPPLVAVLTIGEELRPVYVMSLFFLLPVFVLAMASFRWRRNLAGGSLSPHHLSDITLPLRKWWRHTSVRRVSIARFILEFFYTFMIIFTPIYLHESLGFGWPEIGVMFGIMLLPFVILEWPVGILADRWFGEKEFMTVGFFMTGTTLLVMPFLGKTFLLWTLVLFLSRVGASFIEVTTESYFFKQVNVGDTSLISIFRLVRPAALIAGAALGALTVAVLPYSTIFLVLAVVVFFGMRESVTIKDTL